MKKSLGLLTLFLISCTSSSFLEEGLWSGSLTPMNHPDMVTPVFYEVTYKEGKLRIDLSGPDGIPVPTERPHISGDTLYFSFREPEQHMPLQCALAKAGNREFAGRCTDTSGKWALFRMKYTENS